jgi:long-chain acyl-CoA synthetase
VEHTEGVLKGAVDLSDAGLQGMAQIWTRTSVPAEDAYARKPWLSLYDPGVPAALTRERHDMLSVYRAAVVDPGASAVIYFDGELTFGELDAHSDALAVWLAQNGVGRGERVSVILQNVPHFVIALVAAWKLGAIPVPANPMYRAGELAKLFTDCAPRTVIAHDDQVSTTIEALGKAGLAAAVLSVCGHDFQSRSDTRVLPPRRPAPVGATDFLSAIGAHAGARPPVFTPAADDVGLLLYTSGTTGEPKGAMLRHSSMAFTSQVFRDWSPIPPGSIILGLAPLFHITGIIAHIGAAFSARCPLILHYRFEPSLALDVIRERRPTFTGGAITAFNALMHAPGVLAEDFASFDGLFSGGAPIAPALADAVEATLGQPLFPAYGMTETTSPTHIAPRRRRPPVDPTTGALSIGIPICDTEAMIVTDDGRPAPVGEVGEVWMRGPQIMAGYWNKPEQTAEALVDGWMRSGDVGFMDQEGWFYLVDRKKDMISASGFKVWPREVEDVLVAHPAVREAAVVGMPDDYRGETVKAFVSFKPGEHASAADLIEHCRQHLAAYKAPRVIEVIDELPKTLTGKIQRVLPRGAQPDPPGRQ